MQGTRVLLEDATLDVALVVSVRHRRQPLLPRGETRVWLLPAHTAPRPRCTSASPRVGSSVCWACRGGMDRGWGGRRQDGGKEVAGELEGYALAVVQIRLGDGVGQSIRERAQRVLLGLGAGKAPCRDI